MRNFKLKIEYEGTEFHGWQVQPDCRTVQGELISSAQELSTEPVRVVGAGRTDAGVHATGQAANILMETRLEAHTILKALNARLPKDVIVKSVEETSLEFNARFDAKRRTYRYIFINRKTALWRRYFYEVPELLDTAAMRKALYSLIGEKDFSSFASREDANRSKRCIVQRADLVESPPFINLNITADHFLHKMVRTIAGTVLEAGLGKQIDMDEVIAARSRDSAGPTLPPHALYLVRVDY
ncbi:tRNA pseudouridine(38-40) synthase TruA [bacterium]|nr:MAG: tRNA pseudouridine(38-40) synthase TruA [bacterium]